MPTDKDDLDDPDIAPAIDTWIGRVFPKRGLVAVPDDNVVAIGKLVCNRCEYPITKGQQYAKVRLPGGDEVPVHASCMGGTPLP